MENVTFTQDYQPNAVTARAIDELMSWQGENFHADTFEDFLEQNYRLMANDIEREKAAKEWVNSFAQYKK